MIAIPWYFTMQDDMQRFGLIFVLTNIIALFWVPYCGTLIDKHNRKHIFLVLMGTFGTILLAITAFGFYLGALPWFLVALVFSLTFFNYNVHYPNLYSFVQEISEEKYYGRITSILEIQGQFATILAGAFAAILLEGSVDGMIEILGLKIRLGFDLTAWKIHEIFLVDAITYYIGFAIILFIRFVPLKKRKKVVDSVLDQIKIGYQYLNEHRPIFIFGIASFAIFITILVEGFYLLAIYIKNHLKEGGDVFGSADIIYASGAILSGIFIRYVFKRVSIPWSIIIMTLIMAVAYLTLSFTTDLWIFYTIFLIVGMCNAGARIQRVTFLFMNVPNQVYGRANSIFTVTNIMFRIFFLAIFSLPFFQASNHVIYAFVILSLFLLVAAGVLFSILPKLKELRQ